MITLLVVGDDKATVEDVLCPALPEDGYAIEVVPTIAEAARVLKRRGDTVDVVLVDWSVLETTEPSSRLPEWVRDHVSLESAEVLVHARGFDPDQIDRVMTSGAYYFLNRPFVPSQVFGMIRAAVASCRLKRQVALASRQMDQVAGLLRSGRFEVRSHEDADALASYLGAACGDPQKGIGFLELLRNAVEHGNLGIRYHEKGALLASKTFKNEVASRLTMPMYRDRVVEVVVEATDDRVVVDITDEGPGFDYERYLVMTPDRLFDNHGRGVLLASACLELAYTAPGNHVRAIARR